MTGLIDFFKRFFSNQGHHVFVSLFISKVCAFAGSLLIINLLSEKEFGLISIVAAIFAVFAPINGLGSQQSLLRFGSLIENDKKRQELSTQLFQTGMGYQIIISCLFLLVSLFYFHKYQGILWLFLFFGIRLLGFYFLLHFQSFLRINGDNRKFAKLTNFVNIGGLILVLVLTYYKGLSGYLTAMAVTPFLCLLLINPLKFFAKNELKTAITKEIFNYGIFAAGTALLSDLLFSLDLIIISWFLSENDVAHYKVAILIPANLTFLALVFLQTDFPEIAKNYRNYTFLKIYIINYYKIFIPVCIIIFAIGYLFSKEILNLFFGSTYQNNTLIFRVLLFSFLFNILFRNLYGNLLSAVGKIQQNMWVSLLSILFLLILSFFLIQEYQVVGMSISISIVLVVSGLLLAYFFLQHYRNIKNSDFKA